MIVFGSRGSDLALTQSRQVAERLRAATGVDYRIEVIETKGDRVLDQPLPSIGGKGLFTAELEAALHEGRIDVAVHSMKDLPVQDVPGLTVGGVPPRAHAVDVLVDDPAREDPSMPLVPLRAGSRVGTSSHRRRAALFGARPDLTFADVRGNVPTRVEKVRRGDYAGVMLAAAGLDRLALDLRGLRRIELPAAISTPAPAQGALAVQCRSDDARVRALLRSLHDPITARCAHAERDLLARLGGGCSMPLGALVSPSERGHRLQAVLFANPIVQPEAREGVRIDDEGHDLDAMIERAAQRLRPLIGDPLAGRSVVLLRPDGDGGELAAALQVAGAKVTTLAVTRSEAIAIDAARLPALRRGRVLAFSSVRGVERFFALAKAAGDDLREVMIFAGGPATADAVRAHGHACRTPVEGSGGAALARCLLATTPRPNAVLFACAEERHGAFEAELRQQAVDVLALPVYRLVPVADLQVPPLAGGAVVFTSPSAVRAFAARAHDAKARCLALGPTTAAAMTAAGLRCSAVAATPTAADLIPTLMETCDV